MARFLLISYSNIIMAGKEKLVAGIQLDAGRKKGVHDVDPDLLVNREPPEISGKELFSSL
jgi:hypothetical protein